MDGGVEKASDKETTGQEDKYATLKRIPQCTSSTGFLPTSLPCKTQLPFKNMIGETYVEQEIETETETEIEIEIEVDMETEMGIKIEIEMRLRLRYGYRY